jgi:hypothetical protein
LKFKAKASLPKRSNCAIESLSGRAAVEPRCHSADATDMSFFDLKGRTNAGEVVDFATHKGKCVLAVNVARL